MSSRASRTRHQSGMRKLIVSMLALTLLGSVLTSSGSVGAQTTGPFPWEALGDGGDDAVGAGFDVTMRDLDFIMQGIKIAEAHAAAPVTDPVNDPYNCQAILGDGPDQIPPGPNSEELPWGLRTLSGVCNNLVPGQETYGAARFEFPRLTTPVYRDAETITDPAEDINGPAAPNLTDTTSYDLVTQPSGFVLDRQPRVASNLIVDQSDNNPAAVIAAGEAPPVVPSGLDRDIPNVAPDEGLSAPYNDMFTFFGQFFDHGLDLTTKSGGDFVFMPLNPDDPLFVPGSPMNFMILQRAEGPNGLPVNLTSPFVDQNQTYASHPSHQVFLREWVATTGGPIETGHLIESTVNGGGMSTWADLKAQAASLLGIQLTDHDVLSVPLLATDLYGNFIPGPNGFPQVVMDDASLLEGDPTANAGRGVAINSFSPDFVGGPEAQASGHAFLDDIAHDSVPGFTDPFSCPGPPTLKTGVTDGSFVPDADCTTYDIDMLDTHFIAGDGRVNENIALTAVHHVLHSEHNRLVEQFKVDLAADATPSRLADWQTSPGVWNGQRLFQAAKFVTEMEYQHLAFEEFTRKVQPLVNEFAGYDSSIDASITVEFSQATYRFGHSMLNNGVARFLPDGTDDSMTLFDAFLNPPAFLDGYAGGNEAAGAIFRGGTATVGQEIDEFVVNALRNQLLGLPLDLAAINMARGRDYGIPRLNEMRRQLHVLFNNDSSLAPYANWTEYGLELSTPESLVNFIAAYGTHPDLLALSTMADKRALAELMVSGDILAPADTADFMNGLPPYDVDLGGLEDVDLWVGGLAEKKEIFGGLLGTTHNAIFEIQLENLQDGDRFYYLHRLAGQDLLAGLEGNSFAELIERNTDVENLPADVFSRPDYFFDMSVQGSVPGTPIVDDPATTDYDETTLLIRLVDGTVRFTGGEHSNWAGSAGPDRIYAGEGDDTVRGNDGDDVLEGDGGNDSIIGGEGDDIITDTFGEDSLKGGPGNDAIQGGPLFDLIIGGFGNDFIVQGSDLSETFAGPGDDFIHGGASATIIFGGDGNDWIEGGAQADLLQGGEGAPFQDDPEGGHDILNGLGGADDYDSEGGDDVMLGGPGIQRYEGMQGFDWVTHYNDIQGNVIDQVSDLTRTELVDPPVEGGLFDRFDMVEALSGWIGDDHLLGDTNPIAAVANHNLDAETLTFFNGLADILPDGAATTTWGGDGENILLGGAGSDTLEGRGNDDILDGDRWLRVQIEAAYPGGPVRGDLMADFMDDIFNGVIKPGDLTAVREIITDGVDLVNDVDVAVYQFPQADYNVVDHGGYWTVDHVRGCGDATGADDCGPPANDLLAAGYDEGADRLYNIETIQFADGTLDISAPLPTGLLRVTLGIEDPALPGTALPASPVNAQIVLDGVPRDNWGLNWVEIPIGSHELCFTEVPELTAPGCRTIVIDEGLTTVEEGLYQQNGQLRVQTSPALPATITINGDPANDWGLWNDLPAGEYEVCFGAVEDFTFANADIGTLDGTGAIVPDLVGQVGEVPFPECFEVILEAGGTAGLVGNYSSTPGTAGPTGHGFLRVTTNPPVNAAIYVDAAPGGVVPPVPGFLEDRWGLTWVKVDPGEYQICFGDVEGFSTPGCQEIIVTAGATTTVQGDFTPRASVQVTSNQPGTITLNGVPRDAGEVFTFVPAGVYEICWGDVPGFTAPACQNVNLAAGANPPIPGTYS